MDNIQQILAQLLTNRNTNDTGSNHNDEEHNDDERPKTDKSKESSSIDAEFIKDIQFQIASLAQRDELKKVGMTRPYPLEWDSVPYLLKFKPPTLHTSVSYTHLRAHETPEPVKGYPLRVPMNSLTMIASLPTTLPVCDRK